MSLCPPQQNVSADRKPCHKIAYFLLALIFVPAGVNTADVQALSLRDGVFLLSDTNVAQLGSMLGVDVTDIEALFLTLRGRSVRHLVEHAYIRTRDKMPPQPEPCSWNMMLTRRCNRGILCSHKIHCRRLWHTGRMTQGPGVCLPESFKQY